VAVVEPDPEHPVAESFHDLALHLELLFLAGDTDLPSSNSDVVASSLIVPVAARRPRAKCLRAYETETAGVTFVASGPF
jgi:hypothetical protein